MGIPPVSRETLVRLRKVFEQNGCTFESAAGLEWTLVKVDQGAGCLVRQNFPDATEDDDTD